jgi:hypothetical protein
MITPEPLCDLKMIKADYRLVSHKDREPATNRTTATTARHAYLGLPISEVPELDVDLHGNLLFDGCLK